MANEKISDMAAATTPLDGTELVPLVQGGDNVQTAVSNLTAGRNVDGTSFTVTGNSAPVNGAYLPAANTFGVAANSTLRLSVSTTAVTSTLPIVAPSGGEGAPSYTFTGDPDTGMFRFGANTLVLSCGGANTLVMSTTSASCAVPFYSPAGSAAAVGFAIGDEVNTGIYRSASATLDFASNGIRTLQLNTAASGVNYASLTPGATGVKVNCAAAGSDTNIDLGLSPKGSGVLDIVGTANAGAAIASTHTLNIKIGGAAYKVLLSNV